MDLKTSLRLFFEKQKHCDVTFVCKDSDGKSTSVGAHKLILALASEVFETMFFGESVSLGLFSETKEIQVSNISAASLKLFLRWFAWVWSSPESFKISLVRHFSFIYGQDVKFVDSETVTEFLRAAHEYDCKDALKLAKDYMMRNIDAQSSRTYFEIAELYDFPDLKEAIEKVFS